MYTEDWHDQQEKRMDAVSIAIIGAVAFILLALYMYFGG